jgi:DNA-directed RNA polymerase subunit RPC12/RpoP
MKLSVRFETVKPGLKYVGVNCPNCGFPFYLYFDAREGKLLKAASYAEIIGENAVRCVSCSAEYRLVFEAK